MENGKIKAGALQFVLFVGAVVAVLLMSFILLTYTHNLFEKKTDVLIAMLRSTDYGMEASLREDFSQGSTYTIQNSGELPIKITVKRNFWGVLEKRTVKTTHNNTSFVKTALVGGKDKEKLPALYLNDHQRPLVLAGNSKITGAAFLPKQGIKMGNIYGNSYNRPKLLYGQGMKSDSLLPELSTELEKQIELMTSGNYIPNGQQISRLFPEGIKNSFEQETLIYKDSDVLLKNIVLTGNIIIVADHKIRVEASAELNDVILMAPEIELDQGVMGTLQAIATESIFVGKHCRLSYPSALIVHRNKIKNHATNEKNQPTGNQVPNIFLDTNADVRGFVLFSEENRTIKYHPQIKIATNAVVYGEVYCTGNLELKGSVNGMVATDGFMAMENGNIYQNHLYNGTINSDNLSPAYAGVLLATREENKKVMKWLY